MDTIQHTKSCQHRKVDHHTSKATAITLCKRSLTIIIVMIGVLLALHGWTLLWLSPIYQLTHQNLLLQYEGYLLIVLGLILAIYYRSIVAKLVWASQEMHRIVSAVLMMSFIAIDAVMHMLSIPHMEGWWIPLFGSGATISVISSWVRRRKC